MKISDLIEQLEFVKNKHGNVPVVFQNNHNEWKSSLLYKIAETDDGDNYVPNIEPETKTMFVIGTCTTEPYDFIVEHKE